MKTSPMIFVVTALRVLCTKAQQGKQMSQVGRGLAVVGRALDNASADAKIRALGRQLASNQGHLQREAAITMRDTLARPKDPTVATIVQLLRAADSSAISSFASAADACPDRLARCLQGV